MVVSLSRGFTTKDTEDTKGLGELGGLGRSNFSA
jgi:hypothetical protein